MSKQDNQDTSNQQVLIEDLTVNQDQASEVTGGPESRTFPVYGGFRGGVSVATS